MIILKTQYFSFVVSEWNKFDFNIRKQQALKRTIFDIHKLLGIKLWAKSALVTLMNLNLGLILANILNLGKILNQQCVSFSTAPTFQFLGKFSFKQLGILMISQSKTQLIKPFCMAVKTITRTLTALSLIQPPNT